MSRTNSSRALVDLSTQIERHVPPTKGASQPLAGRRARERHTRMKKTVATAEDIEDTGFESKYRCLELEAPAAKNPTSAVLAKARPTQPEGEGEGKQRQRSGHEMKLRARGRSPPRHDNGESSATATPTAPGGLPQIAGSCEAGIRCFF